MRERIAAGTMALFLAALLWAAPAMAADTPALPGIASGSAIPTPIPGRPRPMAGNREGDDRLFRHDQRRKAAWNGRRDRVHFPRRQLISQPKRSKRRRKRLVERDHVHFIFNGLGTPTNAAVQEYLNQNKIPQLFVASGADRWGDYKQFPWTMGWQPSYRTEAQIYAKYIPKQQPGRQVEHPLPER